MTREEKLKYHKQYYIDHKNEMGLANKRYRQEHKEEAIRYNKQYRQDHREEKAILDRQYRQAHKEEASKYQKQYYLDHKDSLKQAQKQYKRNRATTDIQYYLAHKLRVRLNCALRGKAKVGSAVGDLGCTIDELKSYLESKFKLGMTWENRSLWHIDHIRPLSSFDLTDREQLLIACNWQNLQPLWAQENLLKNNKC